MWSQGSRALTLPSGHWGLLPEPPSPGPASRWIRPPARAAARVLVDHGKHFQPKGRGYELFQQFPKKNGTLLFKHCPNSAPVSFLVSGQLSSEVSSGSVKNGHVERKYSSDRGTRLFSEKKMKEEERNCFFGACLPPTPPSASLPRRPHLVSGKASCFMVSLITALLMKAPLKKKVCQRLENNQGEHDHKLTDLPLYGEIWLSTEKAMEKLLSTVYPRI